MSSAELLQRLAVAQPGREFDAAVTGLTRVPDKRSLTAQFITTLSSSCEAKLRANLEHGFLRVFEKTPVTTMAPTWDEVLSLFRCLSQFQTRLPAAGLYDVYATKVQQCYTAPRADVARFSAIISECTGPMLLLCRVVLLWVRPGEHRELFNTCVHGIQRNPADTVTMKAFQYIMTVPVVNELLSRHELDVHAAIRLGIRDALQNGGPIVSEMALGALNELLFIFSQAESDRAFVQDLLNYVAAPIRRLMEADMDKKLTAGCRRKLVALLVHVRPGFQVVPGGLDRMFVMTWAVRYPQAQEVVSYMKMRRSSNLSETAVMILNQADPEHKREWLLNFYLIFGAAGIFDLDNPCDPGAFNTYEPDLASRVLADAMYNHRVPDAAKRVICLECLVTWMHCSNLSRDDVAATLSVCENFKKQVMNMFEKIAHLCQNSMIIEELDKYLHGYKSPAQDFRMLFVNLCTIKHFVPSTARLVYQYSWLGSQPDLPIPPTRRSLIEAYYGNEKADFEKFLNELLPSTPRVAILLSAIPHIQRDLTSLSYMMRYFGPNWPCYFSDIIENIAHADLGQARSLFIDFVKQGNDKSSIVVIIRDVTAPRDLFDLEHFIQAFYECVGQFPEQLICAFDILANFERVTRKHIPNNITVRKAARQAALRLIDHLPTVPLHFSLFLLECGFGKCAVALLNKCENKDKILAPAIHRFMLSLGDCRYDEKLVRSFVDALPLGWPTVSIVVDTILTCNFQQKENIVRFSEAVTKRCLTPE